MDSVSSFSPTSGLMVCRQLVFSAVNQMGFSITTNDDSSPSHDSAASSAGFLGEKKFRFIKITHYYLTGSAAELVMKRVSGSEMWV